MMDKLIKKLDLMVRYFQNQESKFLATYIASQKKVIEKIRDGRPYVLCTYYIPSEITNIFDVEFIYIERIVGLSISSNIINNVNNHGLPNKICSYHKAFLQLIKQRIIPLPQIIITLDYPCKDALFLCDFLHNSYNIPIYHLCMKNLTDDIRRIYHLLMRKYSIKQSIEKTVELSGQAIILKQQIDYYRQKYPGIIKSNECLKIFTVENDYGGYSAISVLNQIKEEIEVKIKSYSYTNNVKIFWMGLIPLYNNNILSAIEKEFPCKFIYEEMWMLGEYHLTASHFFEDLANKVKSNLFYDTDYRIKKIIDIVKKTKADMVLNLLQKNCSFLPKTVNRISRYLLYENIPIYNFGADVIDGDFNREKLLQIIIPNIK